MTGLRLQIAALLVVVLGFGAAFALARSDRDGSGRAVAAVARPVAFSVPATVRAGSVALPTSPPPLAVPAPLAPAVAPAPAPAPVRPAPAPARPAPAPAPAPRREWTPPRVVPAPQRTTPRPAPPSKQPETIIEGSGD